MTTCGGSEPIADLARDRDLPVFGIAKDRASELLGFPFHRGVLAIARKSKLGFSSWFRENGPNRLVVLENLADPGNVGTIIRNAAAFGFDAVLSLGGGASPYNAKAVRASATGIFSVPVFSLAEEEMEELTRLEGVRFVATVSSAEGPTSSLDAVVAELRSSESDPLVVFFGSESEGISPWWAAASRWRIRIPISHRVESLNVASASAILLHALGSPDSEGT